MKCIHPFIGKILIFKCGYTILFEQKSIVTHKHEEGAIKKTQKSSYIHSIVVRNQFLFVWNNLTDSMIFFNHLVSLPLHLARAVADKDFSFVKGFFQAVLRLQDVFTFRSQMTKRFTKTDNQVIAEVNR
jgi:hypothetical protein